MNTGECSCGVDDERRLLVVRQSLSVLCSSALLSMRKVVLQRLCYVHRGQKRCMLELRKENDFTKKAGNEVQSAE